MTHRIGIIGGDGIGPDVIAEGLKVIGAAGVELETVDYDLGGARYGRDGTVLPDEVIEEWRSLDALYLGAVGTPEVPPGLEAQPGREIAPIRGRCGALLEHAVLQEELPDLLGRE